MKRRVLRVVGNAIAALAPETWARAVAWAKGTGVRPATVLCGGPAKGEGR